MFENRDGFWGPVTSSVDWCERNYEYSPYIAEMFNTVSNLFYIICTILSVWNLHNFYNTYFSKENSTYRIHVAEMSSPLERSARNGNVVCEPTGVHGRLFRFYFSGLFVVFVGIGSWMFHMTLQLRDQMLDEISMHMPIIALLYALLNFKDYQHVTEKDRFMKYFLSRFHFLSLLVGICAFAVLLSIYNVHKPIIFVVTFFFEMIFSYGYTLIYARTLYNKSKTARRHRKQKLQLAYCIFASFIFAFGVWNIDKLFCCKTIDYLKLHSIWHLFTAYGCYLWGTFVIFAYYADKYDYLTSKNQIPKGGKGYSIAWKYYILPTIHFNDLSSTSAA
jgi:dihydroceramidase